MAGEVGIQTVQQLINSVRLDRLVHLIRHNAKPQNVSGKHNKMTITNKLTKSWTYFKKPKSKLSTNKK